MKLTVATIILVSLVWIVGCAPPAKPPPAPQPKPAPDCSAAQKQVADLQAQVKNLTSQNTSLQSQLKEANTEKSKYMAESAQLRANCDLDASNNLKALQAKYAQLDIERAKAIKDRDALALENDNLKKQLEEATK